MNSNCCPIRKPFRILYPSGGAVLRALTSVRGYGIPGASVSVRVAGGAPVTVRTESDGSWTLPYGRTLANGQHFILAQTYYRGCCYCDQVAFRIAVPTPVPPTPPPEPLPPPVILYPAHLSSIAERTPVITGTAEPGNTVTVCLAPFDCLTALADQSGSWAVQFPGELPDGLYSVTASQTDGVRVSPSAQNDFEVRGGRGRLDPPVIVTPPNGAVISERRPLIGGTADPGNTVTVCLDPFGCLNTTADAGGNWSVTFPAELPDGPYTVTATQSNALGDISPESVSSFTVQNSEPLPPPTIDSPPNGAVISERRPPILGTAIPGNTVTVCLGSYGCLDTVANESGSYGVTFPVALPVGSYTVTARQTSPDGRVSADVQSGFAVEAGFVPPPTIDTPGDGAVITDPIPWIVGRGEPGMSVRLCLAGVGCQTAPVDDSGVYRVQFPSPLPDAVYQATAVQIDEFGTESTSVSSSFQVVTGNLLVEPLEIRMGDTFRTVSIRFALSGAVGTATVYYVMKKTGLPAPTVADMKNYANTAELEDGTAARGAFAVPVSAQLEQISRTIRGRELNPTALETGAIDGWNYEVWLYAELTPAVVSGVVVFGAAAMSNPFDGGSGTAADPYLARELTAAELENYPDLKAGHPVNDAGTNRPARMLENIERLEELYDDTDGVHGRIDSLAQSYRLESDFDLAPYASAFGGNGWKPIGNYDASYYGAGLTGRHIFTGTLQGRAGGSTVSNLSLTPTADANRWVGYVALVGRARSATISDINLQNVTVAPNPSDALGALYAGAFTAFSSLGTFRNLNASQVAMTFPNFGSGTKFVLAGTLAGDFATGTADNIRATGVSLNGPGVAYSYCGGLVGSAHNEDGQMRFSACTIENFSAADFPNLVLYTGGLAGLLYSDTPTVLLQDISVSGVSVPVERASAGGAIGFITVRTPLEMERVTLNNIQITTGTEGYHAGGLAGTISNTATMRISNVSVTNSDLSAAYGSAGIVGRLLDYAGNTEIGQVTVSDSNFHAQTSYAGGVVGYSHRDDASHFYLHDATVNNVLIDATFNSGGLVGDLLDYSSVDDFNYFDNCAVNARVMGSDASRNTGGLVGFGEYLAFRNCSFAGFVKGGTFVGGILGAGWSLSLENCSVTAPVEGLTEVGGLIGQAGGYVFTPSAPNPPFPATNDLVTRCYVTSNVTLSAGGSIAGGLFGSLDAMHADQCWSKAEVIAPGMDALGGLVGETTNLNQAPPPNITNCYALGSIAGGGTHVGGIAGRNVGQIDRCYSAGGYSGENLVGGIAGGHTPQGASQLEGDFALGTQVAATGPDAARIANEDNTLVNNGAISTLQLVKNGAPAVPVSDPNGRDGQTVEAAGLFAALASAGWDPAIWNFGTIASLGRPVLINNPEI